jgi:hypothetical protein
MSEPYKGLNAALARNSGPSAEDVETWTEWGVRRTWGMVGTVARLDRRTAERCAEEWPGELVSRTVTASEWIRVAPSAARIQGGA